MSGCHVGPSRLKRPGPKLLPPEDEVIPSGSPSECALRLTAAQREILAIGRLREADMLLLEPQLWHGGGHAGIYEPGTGRVGPSRKLAIAHAFSATDWPPAASKNPLRSRHSD